MNTLRFHFALFTISLFLIFNAPTFKAQSPLDGFDPNANGYVSRIVLQPDGKILIGGSFTTLAPNGGATVTRNRIARLNPDGTLDAAFNPNISGSIGSVARIVLQPDGKILVGGYFTTIAPNGGAAVTRNNIARLNADGSLDATFNPNANDAVRSLALQADGKILIGGHFTTVAPNGGAAVSRLKLARLNADGSLDMTFDPRVGNTHDEFVSSIAVQPDGKILLGGGFSRLTPNGGATVLRHSFARLNTDGTVDAAFNPNPNALVYSVSLQPDGKILIGGYFWQVAPNGGAPVSRLKVARINPDGTLDMTFDPHVGDDLLNDYIHLVEAQPDGKIFIGGEFRTLAPNGGAEVSRAYLARVNADGTLDEAFYPGPNAAVTAVAAQPSGKILIGGGFTALFRNGVVPSVSRNRIARLERDGSFDQTLNLGVISNTMFSNVQGIAIQPDGKIIIGGVFSNVLGTPRNNIARLNADGSLDTTFDPNANRGVYSIALQADGKILIAGQLSTLAPNGGAAVTRRIARLNADGTVEATFNPNPDGYVNSIALQPDGKIIIGGSFSVLAPPNGAMSGRNNIARLNADGTVDASFDPNLNHYKYVLQSIAVQPDGKILVGGHFTTLAPNGGAAVARNNIARLNANGTVDATFDPNANNGVSSIVMQSDGKILIGGEFTSLAPNGGAAVARNHIARLNADGTVDAAFNPNASNGVFSIVPQSDGRIFIGGTFTSLAPNGGAAVFRNYIARLNADGTVDTTFSTSSGDYVLSIAAQADGKILIGGTFTSIFSSSSGVIPRYFFARLSNNTAALSSLAVTRTAVTLTRDGSAAQLTRVVFEQSIDNGANYTLLGTATNSFASPVGFTAADESSEGKRGVRLAPQAAGYTLNGLNLPTGQNILIRARGFYRTGIFNSSETIEDKVQIAFLPVPTAAQVSVSGRVMTPDGSGLKNARVVLTDANGNSRTAVTGSFGYFRFDDVQAGETYVVSIVAKGRQFAPQAVTVNEELSELNFTALE